MASRNCPRCKSLNSLARVPKGGFSRVLARFIEVYKYRCEGFTCKWEGLIFPSFNEKSLTEILLPYIVVIGIGITGLGFYYLLSVSQSTNQNIKKLNPTANL